MSLSAVLGQDRALRLLRVLLESGRVPPALLFRGPRGVGKALAAFEFAKALNCREGEADSCSAGSPCPSCSAADRGVDPDLQRVDAAYQAGLLDEEPEKQRSIKIETVRHAVRTMEMRSLEGRWKTAILEDAHNLVPAAANAMLKGLEEPPPRTLWILVTHRPAELLETVRSRCQPVPFGIVPPDAAARILRERGAGAEEARAAADRSEGSVARALEALETAAPGPEDWVSDPMAPFRLADALPRELHRSRPLVEDQLHRIAWHVRGGAHASYARPAARAVLRELAELRRSLRSNADPRLVLQLAALRLQSLQGPS